MHAYGRQISFSDELRPGRQVGGARRRVTQANKAPVCSSWQTSDCTDRSNTPRRFPGLLPQLAAEKGVEVVDGIFEALFELDGGFPTEFFLGEGDIGAALPGVVLGEWTEDEF